MRMPGAVVLIAALAFCGICAMACAGDDETTPTLEVYVQPGKSPAEEKFATEMIPWLAEQARARKMEMKVIDAAGGAPRGVGATPGVRLSFGQQNLVFYGQAFDREELGAFVLNREAPVSEPPVRSGAAQIALTWNNARQGIDAALTVHPIAGVVPDSLPEAQFLQDAGKSIAGGFRHFREGEFWSGEGPDVAGKSVVDFDFFCDATADGRFSVTPRIASPEIDSGVVFSRSDSDIVVTGKWQDREAVFAEAARRIEELCAKALPSLDFGGGLLPAPDAPLDGGIIACGIWTAKPPASYSLDSSATGNSLKFRFPHPAAEYAGEVKKFTVRLEQADRQTLKGATFEVVVDATTATMGEKALDETVAYSLESEAHPTASFTLRIDDDIRLPKSLGQPLAVGISGEFEMLGQKSPVFVRGEFVRLLAPDGSERIRLTGDFQIRLKPYKIMGPEVEWPMNEIVLLHARFYMVPAEKKD